MAERSKAPVSGTGLFGGVGSNPTPIIVIFFWDLSVLCVSQQKICLLAFQLISGRGTHGKKNIARRRKNCRDWESHPGFRCHKAGYCYYTISASVVLRHRGQLQTLTDRQKANWDERCGVPVATLAKRLMRLPRKQKVVSSNLTGGSFFFFFFFSARKSSHFVKELFVHSGSVPVAQLDKAPDYESGDWGFKSLLGYFFQCLSF